ncbi:MAG: hypothetical protein KDJ35_06660 [Alphaproteobacteria bacterium]|nr:hypothetical protein [Alphaproteobacteria bacterium]
MDEEQETTAKRRLKGEFQNAQENVVGVIASSPTVKSFEPDNAFIRAGTVQLNKISQYLADLPDTATATLLVSPQDLANIDGGGLGTWVNSVKRTGEIKGYHGLDGMEVYDRPHWAPDVSLEEDITRKIKILLDFAQSSGKEVTTGLFMPMKQLLHGREIGSGDVTVDTNLCSKRKEIGKQGYKFITKDGSDNASCYWSANEDPVNSSIVYNVCLTDGVDDWVHKDGLKLFSIPVALAFQPPA